ncbi:MAG: tRNA dihydrouridine synthase DusB [Gracilibacteraceae bacterium]|jgi:nifR3 family TIM-barrel protein|nr:tRNA dihydrouridine synthase DusB [Gracilibacteraceae bacterium]
MEKSGLTPPVYLAPMAGVTDRAFREIAREISPARVMTEMISAKALLRNNRKTWAMLALAAEAPPRLAQLFGRDAGEVAAAAQILAEAGADGININMGCPTAKIVKNGEGAALLRDPAQAAAVARAAARAVSIPVSVKCRLGWNEAEADAAARLAPRWEEAGVACLIVHGRTREQFYAGRADWAAIAAVRAATGLPVIANGDVASPADARAALSQTGCAGVMIGRAALGNPWLLAAVSAALAPGPRVWRPPSPLEREKVALRHLDKLLAYKGEYIGVREMRKHFAWYCKGLRGAAALRAAALRAESAADLRALMREAFEPAERESEAARREKGKDSQVC